MARQCAAASFGIGGRPDLLVQHEQNFKILGCCLQVVTASGNTDMAAVAESCRDFGDAQGLETIRDHALSCSLLLCKTDVEADIDFMQQQRVQQARCSTVIVSVANPTRSAAVPSKASTNAAAGRNSSNEGSCTVGCSATDGNMAVCSNGGGTSAVSLLADSRHPAAPSATTQVQPQAEVSSGVQLAHSAVSSRSLRKRC